jgi:hypothetical protein
LKAFDFMSARDSGRTIAVIRFSSLAGEDITRFREEWLDGNTMPSSQMKIPGELPDRCYGVSISDDSMVPVLRQGATAIFSDCERLAKENIYCVGRKGQVPVIRKLVKNDGPVSPRRKSFMTPTPLHIPESKISPIADSTHRMLMLKSLAGDDPLLIIPAEQVIWMHPLVAVLDPGDDCSRR